MPGQERDELASRIAGGAGNGDADNPTWLSLTRSLLGKLILENGVRFLQCPRRPVKEYLYTQCINMLFIAKRLCACQEKNLPRLYPGCEVPNPIVIEINKGDAPIETVLQDILSLTKLNYNTCIFGDGMPITLKFADAIGEILTAAPLKDVPPLSFSNYI